MKGRVLPATDRQSVFGANDNAAIESDLVNGIVAFAA